MQNVLRNSGIEVIGDIPWGTHFCQFYSSKDDLLHILVPYMKAGLENNEACMWVTSPPLAVEEAKHALAMVVPDLAARISSHQLEIISHSDWYLEGGYFDLQRVLNGWLGKLKDASARGCNGLRVTGNTAWLEKKDWRNFTEYEAAIDDVIGQYNLLALCTYSLDKCDAAAIIDVIRNHEFALVSQQGKWDLIESAAYKQTKEALKKSQEELSIILGSMPLLVLVVDAERRVLRANTATAKFAGRRVEEMLGLRAGEALRCLNSAEDPRGCGFGAACANCKVRLTIFDAFENGSSHYQVGWSLPLLRNGRSENVDLLVSTIPLPPAKQQVLLCIEDITELKRTEEELRETRDYLENLLNYANAPIIVWDSQFQITRFNHAFERLAGLNAREVFGKRLDMLFPEDSRDESMGRIRDAMRGQRWETVEIPILRKDGAVRTVLWNSATLYSADGKGVAATIAQGQDITERKQIEEEVRRLNKGLLERAAELEATNRELESFSYSVSHDLKAPLRHLEGFSQMLLEDYAAKLDAPGQDFLHRIVASTDQMNHLIEAMLDLSRLTRAEMHMARVDMSKLAKSVTNELQSTQPDRQVRITIAPGVIAHGDESLLRIAMENLLGNAWKFTGKTSIPTIEFGTTHVEGKLTYFVRDNGAGFDMAYFGKLFTPFQRLHSAEEFSGTGIGLATVLRIIRRHGGHVWAEGGIGKGATFYFTLG